MFFQVLASGLGLLVSYHICSLAYTFVQNYRCARSTLRLPTVSLPMLDQNAAPWMILSPICLCTLERWLPTWLFSRLTLAIYGWEQREHFRPFNNLIKPQLKANSQLQGSGKTMALATSGRLEIYSWDKEFAQEVASRVSDFNQFEIASLILGVFGQNVLTTDGDTWRRHRRVVASAVTERTSNVVFSESVRQTKMLLNDLGALTQAGAPSNAESNRIFDLLKRVAIHVLYAAGMGDPQAWDQLEGEKEQLEPGYELTYIEAVKSVNDNAAGTIVLPYWLLSNWPMWLPGATNLRQLARAKIEFPKHTRVALEREKRLTKETGRARNNVMNALIAASNEGDEAPLKTRGQLPRKGPSLTDEELVANLYIFTAAGFDTTANTMAYALVQLALFPQWQEWLCEELDKILPADPNEEPDYVATYPQATRTLSVMMETLRLFPPIIHLGKQTKKTQRVTTSSGVYSLPPKTTVYIDLVALQQDPEVWRDLNINSSEKEANEKAETTDGLADEARFRPSRWINNDTAEDPSSVRQMYKPHPSTFMAWSAGPRVCPGSRMAQVEFVGVFLTLFRHHRLEAVKLDVPCSSASSESDSTTGTNSHRKETTEEVHARMNRIIKASINKVTLEMPDVYNVDSEKLGKGKAKQGLPMRWVRRK